MLDAAGARKVAQDFCDAYKKHYEILITREIACADPPATYFALGAADKDLRVTGGIAGILVRHETGQVEEFGPAWSYGWVEQICLLAKMRTDPAFVFQVLLVKQSDQEAFLKDALARMG